MNPSDSPEDVQAVQSIGSVPMIMKVIAETTGLRFVCIARVTADSWITCAALDQLNFGLKPGDHLKLSTTLCNKVRESKASIIIDNASLDPAFCDHSIPKMYGFESYFSIPIHWPNGDFFGTLCGLDPLPANLKTPKVRDMLTLFADLISRQLESERRLASAETALRDERENAELREQFIAVLGHDLRTPLSSIQMVTETLRYPLDDNKALPAFDHIGRCARRISTLIDNLMNFTRGRMNCALPVTFIETNTLEQRLRHVVSELESTYKDCTIHADIHFDNALICDPERLAQLLSNLLVNALTHGDANHPVSVSAHCTGDGLTLAVSNAGSPIPKQALSRLFQPFWRGTSRDSSEGLGLGLYIASEIARSHNGTVTVQSTTELTTFTFSAKVMQPEAKKRTDKPRTKAHREQGIPLEPEITQPAGDTTDAGDKSPRSHQANTQRAHRSI